MSELDHNSKTDVVPLDGPVDDPHKSPIQQDRVRLGNAKRWFLTTLSRKNLMALTGLLLCLFLVVQPFYFHKTPASLKLRYPGRPLKGRPIITRLNILILQYPASFAQPASQPNIGFAWSRVTGGMVV